MLDIGLSCLTLTPRLALNRNDRFDRSDYNDVLDASLSFDHGRCVRRDMARTLALLSPRARQCEALPIPLPPAAVAAERRADLSSLPGRTPPHVDAGGSDVLGDEERTAHVELDAVLGRLGAWALAGGHCDDEAVRPPQRRERPSSTARRRARRWRTRRYEH